MKLPPNHRSLFLNLPAERVAILETTLSGVSKPFESGVDEADGGHTPHQSEATGANSSSQEVRVVGCENDVPQVLKDMKIVRRQVLKGFSWLQHVFVEDKNVLLKANPFLLVVLCER
ncbi:hypothetical protein COL940_012286 [Colletotrichum noveboracense]|nr:hypothetical protein COL940_012286 [Colletotrichum noveboracense]